MFNCLQEELQTNLAIGCDRNSGWELLPCGQQDLHPGEGVYVVMMGMGERGKECVTLCSCC